MLITGDHPVTADAIAAELGILHPGNDVIDCTDPAADLADPRARVFARATPEQKLAIITARQAAGDVVAMAGDGVNDGPALRRADIGVAMGRRGTEVARQAANLVLADDNLQTVVTAAGEGRRVYGSICRFLLYGLCGGSAEIAVMLAGPALGLALPLLPAQILWVNLLTYGLPGVALGGEPAEPGIMTRPPGRRPKACSAPGCGSGSYGAASWSPRSPWASPCGATPPGDPGRAWPSSRSAPPSSPSRSDRGPGPEPWPTRCCPPPSPPPWHCRGARAVPAVPPGTAACRAADRPRPARALPGLHPRYAAVRLDRIMFRPIQRRFEAGPGDPDLRGRPKSRLGGPSSPYQAGRWTTLSLPAGPA